MSLHPLYIESCSTCVFLGQHPDADGQLNDLYFCPQGGNIPTVKARWGDKPQQYLSGLRMPEPVLQQAELLARARGLLKNG